MDIVSDTYSQLIPLALEVESKGLLLRALFRSCWSPTSGSRVWAPPAKHCSGKQSILYWQTVYTVLEVSWWLFFIWLNAHWEFLDFWKDFAVLIILVFLQCFSLVCSCMHMHTQPWEQLACMHNYGIQVTKLKVCKKNVSSIILQTHSYSNEKPWHLVCACVGSCLPKGAVKKRLMDEHSMFKSW